MRQCLEGKSLVVWLCGRHERTHPQCARELHPLGFQREAAEQLDQRQRHGGPHRLPATLNQLTVQRRQGAAQQGRLHLLCGRRALGRSQRGSAGCCLGRQGGLGGRRSCHGGGAAALPLCGSCCWRSQHQRSCWQGASGSCRLRGGSRRHSGRRGCRAVPVVLRRQREVEGVEDGADGACQRLGWALPMRRT